MKLKHVSTLRHLRLRGADGRELKCFTVRTCWIQNKHQSFHWPNTLLFGCKNDEWRGKWNFHISFFCAEQGGGHSAALQMLKGFYHYLLFRDCKNNPFFIMVRCTWNVPIFQICCKHMRKWKKLGIWLFLLHPACISVWLTIVPRNISH